MYGVSTPYNKICLPIDTYADTNEHIKVDDDGEKTLPNL